MIACVNAATFGPVGHVDTSTDTNLDTGVDTVYYSDLDEELHRLYVKLHARVL